MSMLMTDQGYDGGKQGSRLGLETVTPMTTTSGEQRDEGLGLRRW